MREVDLTSGGRATVAFDPQLPFIRVTGHGFLDQDGTETFLRDIGNAVKEARRRGPVRVLIDGKSLVAQSAETVNRVRERTGSLYRDGDRVAVVVESMLFTLQLQRSVADKFRRLFTSEDEAVEWLGRH